MCENGMDDGIDTRTPEPIGTTCIHKYVSTNMHKDGLRWLTNSVQVCSEMRRGWDSNPRNTLISVHRISNAAHSTNSDTSPESHFTPNAS